MAVDVEVKDMPNSQKQLKISVSADECKNAYEAVLSRLSRQVDPRPAPACCGRAVRPPGNPVSMTRVAAPPINRRRAQVEIPGFRKGKAPTAMVLNHFGKESIQAEACEKIIGAAVPMALQMKDIRAIGQAQMADETAVAKMLEQFKPGQGVDFEVLVDVWPEAALSGSYTGQTLEAEEEPFEEELILNALSEMRKREAASAVASADTVATVYPSKLDDSAEIQARHARPPLAASASREGAGGSPRRRARRCDRAPSPSSTSLASSWPRAPCPAGGSAAAQRPARWASVPS
jgi:hypothetical protein